MQINSTNITVFSIGIMSITGVLALKRDDSIASILYAVSLALLVSSIFFSITVIVPEAKRRSRIRRGLRKQYRSFKRRCIDLFLISAKSQDYQKRDNLLDHQEFRRYFSNKAANGQSRWDLVVTSIDKQDYIFQEIVRELEFFSREIEFVRSSIDIDDEEVEEFLLNLNRIIHTFKTTEAHSDDYKYFCRTLWGIFARWNFIDGQLEEDIIESMIKRI